MAFSSTAEEIGAWPFDSLSANASSEEILASLDVTVPRTAVSNEYGVALALLAVGLALKRGPEFRNKMQNAQKALQKYDMQFDSFFR